MAQHSVISFALGAMLFGLCASAQAQQHAKVSRIGFLSLSSRSSTLQAFEAFQQGLQELGYVEGQNIVIELRWADGKVERLPELAVELVRLKVDVIVVGPVQPALAARNATRAIPIVFATVADPIAFGLVTNLAQARRYVCGQDFERRKARRLTCGATDKVRIHHQSQNREADWINDPSKRPGESESGDPVNNAKLKIKNEK